MTFRRVGDPAEVLLWEGNQALVQGDLPKAKACYTLAKQSSSWPRKVAHYKLADIERLDYSAHMIITAEFLVNLGNRVFNLITPETRAYSLEEAEYYYDSALKINAVGSAWLGLGCVAEWRHNYNRAKAYFAQATAFPETRSEAFEALGDLAEENREAESFYGRAFSEKPTFELGIKLGELAVEQGDRRKAIHYFTQASVIDPTESDIQARLGYKALYLNDYIAAYKHFQTVFKLCRTWPRIAFTLGEIALKLNRYKDAYDHFLTAQMDYSALWGKFYQDSERDFLHLGDLAMRLGYQEAACQHYLEAIRRNPRNASVLAKLGAMSLQWEEWGNSFKYYSEAAGLDPKFEEDLGKLPWKCKFYWWFKQFSGETCTLTDLERG